MADLQPPPTYANPVLVDERTGEGTFNPLWLKWFVDLAGVINAAGGLTLDHNSLAGLQGGTSGEYFHLTSAQHTAIASLGSLTANTVVFADAAGALSTEAAFGYNSSTNLLTVDNLTVADDLTIGSASGDTLTINAGTWTIGNDFTATHAMGTVPNAAAQTPHSLDVTFTSGGSSTYLSAWKFDVEGQGSNPMNGFSAFFMDAKHAGSATCDLLLGMQANARVMSSGDASTAYAYFGAIAAQGSGDATVGRIFYAAPPFAPSAGRIPTIVGFTAADLGHASAVDTAIGHDCADFTAGPTLSVAYRGQLTAGTGKHNLYMSGTAVNYLKGALGLDVLTPTISSTGLLDMNADTLRLRTSRTPSSASDTGNAGEICWDADYIYVATATNTWKRSAISTW